MTDCEGAFRGGEHMGGAAGHVDNHLMHFEGGGSAGKKKEKKGDKRKKRKEKERKKRRK